MELRVEPVTFPEVIQFNYEELKAEITSKVEMYKNLVYTGSDQIKDAKADRAALNKLIKAMSDERIRIKKDCLKPYDEFERKIRELTDIVNEPVQLIDKQIKEYEQTLKEEKRKEIEALFETIGFQAFVKLEMIWDEKWLNASVSMKSIEDAMRARLNEISTAVFTLNKLPEFGFEALELYKETLDLQRQSRRRSICPKSTKKKRSTKQRKRRRREARKHVRSRLHRSRHRSSWNSRRNRWLWILFHRKLRHSRNWSRQKSGFGLQHFLQPKMHLP